MSLKKALAGGLALSGIALALAIAPFAYAASPGSFYAFGDSLVDNGNIPRLTGIPYPPSPPYYEYHFSNGPVWAEYLPGLTGLDFQPSNDYGVGGAFTGPLTIDGQTFNNISNVEGFPAPLPSFLQEIQSFASKGGHFTSRDVVGVWVGANNYFVAAGQILADPAQYKQIIIGAVTTAITQTSEGIVQLAQLGARQIIVQSLPPLGATPEFNANPLESFVADQISTAHDAALERAIATIHQKIGTNIILINQSLLFKELLVNPGAFGITNVTDACRLTAACLGQPLSVQNQYLFWGNVHPTTHTHLLVAEYSASALNNLDSLAAPARLLASGAEAFSASISARMDALRNGASGISVNLPSAPMLADAAEGDTGPMGPMPDHRLSVYVTGGYDYGSRSNAPGNLGFSDNIGTVTAGADYRFNPHIAAGLAFGYGTDNATVNGGANVQAHAYQFAAYAMAQSRHLFLDGQVDYGIAQVTQFSAPGVLVPMTAAPGGHTDSVVVNGGYLIRRGALAFGPIVGLDATQANVNAYTQQGDPALVMAVQTQSLSRTIASFGLGVSASAHIGALDLRPHGSIEGQAELDGTRGSFASVFTDEPLVGLTTNFPNQATRWGVADIGATATIFGQLAASVDLATTFARSDGNQRMVTAGMRYRF
ncbi:autotransporter domain-containing protein [Acidiphilium sp. AL]|uniref:Autotransporter domain-containing protein n=1 Tax=Acidiphilium iwatense TaxID=768198 RepID=A0ABS9DWC6_9PROT|nr:MULTISPECIES: autotransporter domain-containing protein [Acidiphilium]MCF3947044.1 autotransporter domain-containing protein [Acidiphilium iwatense]MCU4160446.1 autotransporter domain-containing protein [Acidiphilium sp. AL]